jgi:hypothetical protein
LENIEVRWEESKPVPAWLSVSLGNSAILKERKLDIKILSWKKCIETKAALIKEYFGCGSSSDMEIIAFFFS